MEFRFGTTDQGLNLKRIHDVYLVVALLTARLGAAFCTDRQDVLGLDGDLYLLVIRVCLPATFTRRTSRVTVPP